MHPSAQHGRADGLAPSRVHRAAAARQHRRAGGVPGLSDCARRSERGRAPGVRLAGGADPHRLFSVAHRPIRKRACAVLAGAGGTGHDCCGVDRRHRFLRRDLARGRAARGGAFGVAPRRRDCLDFRARRGGAVGAARQRAFAADAQSQQRMPRWRRSASFRRRSTPRGSRSAPSRWRGPASGCFTPRRIATGCWRAT